MTDSDLDEMSELLHGLSSCGDEADSPSNIWMGLSPVNQGLINNHGRGHSRNQCPPGPGVTVPYLNSIGPNRRGGGDAAANASCEGCLNLEVNLEENKFEILFLTEDNLSKDAKISELITKVQNLEGKIKANQDEMEELRMDTLSLEENGGEIGQRDQNDTNSLLEKLYSVAGTVLKGLGGNVPPLDLILEEEGINFSLNPKSVKTLCNDLHSKFVVWQENHKMMHVELEKTLKIVEKLETEEFDSQVNQAVGDPPTPSSLHVYEDGSHDKEKDDSMSESEEPLCSIFSTFSLSEPASSSSGHVDGVRRNPLRKCRLGTGSYNEKSACKDHLPGVFEIACDKCDRAFSRLTKVTSTLTRNQNRRNAQVTPRPDIQATTGSSSSHQKMGRVSSSSNSIRKAKRCRDASTNTGRSSQRRPPPQRPKMIVTDPSGQEHKYAGFYMTILPSEQIRSFLEGMPPTKKRRCFCKCGKHYSDFSSIYRHLKFIQKNSNSPNHEFQIRSREM